jgi:putative tryptophan/tyrosine transport system substrate-binding protein
MCCTLAAAARLPTMHSTREYVEAGGLLSYGPNYADLFRRAGNYVDKILRGAKPGDLPVEQPVKFDLVVNLVVAKALGIEIPPRCSPAPTRSSNNATVLLRLLTAASSTFAT